MVEQDAPYVSAGPESIPRPCRMHRKNQVIRIPSGSCRCVYAIPRPAADGGHRDRHVLHPGLVDRFHAGLAVRYGWRGADGLRFQPGGTAGGGETGGAVQGPGEVRQVMAGVILQGIAQTGASVFLPDYGHGRAVCGNIERVDQS